MRFSFLPLPRPYQASSPLIPRRGLRVGPNEARVALCPREVPVVGMHHLCGSLRQETAHHLLGLREARHEAVGHYQILLGDEGHGVPFPPSAASEADTMHVLHDMCRHVVIYNEGDVAEIVATAEDMDIGDHWEVPVRRRK